MNLCTVKFIVEYRCELYTSSVKDEKSGHCNIDCDVTTMMFMSARILQLNARYPCLSIYYSYIDPSCIAVGPIDITVRNVIFGLRYKWYNFLRKWQT